MTTCDMSEGKQLHFVIVAHIAQRKHRNLCRYRIQILMVILERFEDELNQL